MGIGHTGIKSEIPSLSLRLDWRNCLNYLLSSWTRTENAFKAVAMKIMSDGVCATSWKPHFVPQNLAKKKLTIKQCSSAAGCDQCYFKFTIPVTEHLWMNFWSSLNFSFHRQKLSIVNQSIKLQSYYFPPILPNIKIFKNTFSSSFPVLDQNMLAQPLRLCWIINGTAKRIPRTCWGKSPAVPHSFSQTLWAEVSELQSRSERGMIYFWMSCEMNTSFSEITDSEPHLGARMISPHFNSTQMGHLYYSTPL